LQFPAPSLPHSMCAFTSCVACFQRPKICYLVPSLGGSNEFATQRCLGALSANRTAAVLNERGIPTAAGNKWTAVQVIRVRPSKDIDQCELQLTRRSQTPPLHRRDGGKWKAAPPHTRPNTGQQHANTWAARLKVLATTVGASATAQRGVGALFRWLARRGVRFRSFAERSWSARASALSSPLTELARCGQPFD
jgi:hypothetical protein